MSKGGKREGAGRPKGSVKAEGVRPQHQLRAYPDEWQLILKFARLVKHGEKDKCAEFVNNPPPTLTLRGGGFLAAKG